MAMDKELLLEIGLEELPASWLPGLTRQLAERLAARLFERRLSASDPEPFSTPRRLGASVARLADRQGDLEETITGPPVSAALDKDGRPTPAGQGFARKQGVAFEDLARVQTPKGEYLAYRKREQGRSAADVLPEVLAAVLRDLAFPKQMRWDARLDDGRGELLFGRPIRWLLFLYGGRVVPFVIRRSAEAGGPQVQDVVAGAVTYGHRFLTTSGRPGRSIRVKTFADYRRKLAEHFVVLDRAERRERIARDLEARACRLGGHLLTGASASILDEVPDLVEYPGVIAGSFDPAFLQLPPEVLTTTMIHHQHHFPVVEDSGRLKPVFLAVTNTQPDDERPIAANAERVLAARLRDAAFFWDTDRRTPLHARLDRLDTVLFHKALGSYRKKAERMADLAEWIAREAFGRPDQAEFARRAALLAKADLTTDMVREFTELQGTMGGIYAREDGQPEEIWKAIYHHYLPIGVEADAPPLRADLGAAAVTWASVSLADKLDTVVGLFGAGERPTGSRDPFGLRRQAQGVVKILADLPDFGVDRAPTLAMLVRKLVQDWYQGKDAPETQSARLSFWLDRLDYLLRQRGFPDSVVKTVLHKRMEDLSPLVLLRRARALETIRREAEFADLARLYKRINNIVHMELGSLGGAGVWGQGRALLTEPSEMALRRGLDDVGPEISSLGQSGLYLEALKKASTLAPLVDRFFDDVLVNVERQDLRQARLALLGELRDLIWDIGDISYLAPGQP
jgi:glycyl-tRNA synthetase beta chain